MPQDTLDKLKAMWNSHGSLDGLVVTFDELRLRFPGNAEDGPMVLKGRFGQDRFNPGYNAYAKAKVDKRDAHGCPECERIVIEPPIFEEYDDLRGPRAGSAGIRIRCANPDCGSVLGDCKTKFY